MVENFRRGSPMFLGTGGALPVYCWKHDGMCHRLDIDKENVINAKPLQDGSGIIVLQSQEKHGHDNVIVLNADGSESFRVKNPYVLTADYKDDDEYYFYGVVVVTSGEVILEICTKQTIPGKSYAAEPIYEACYDEHIKELRSLKWKPWD